MNRQPRPQWCVLWEFRIWVMFCEHNHKGSWFYYYTSIPSVLFQVARHIVFAPSSNRIDFVKCIGVIPLLTFNPNASDRSADLVAIGLGHDKQTETHSQSYIVMRLRTTIEPRLPFSSPLPLPPQENKTRQTYHLVVTHSVCVCCQSCMCVHNMFRLCIFGHKCVYMCGCESLTISCFFNAHRTQLFCV